VERWLARFGNDAMRAGYARYLGRKRDFLTLLLKIRGELDANYKADKPVAEKRAVKARLFQQLKDEYQVLKASWGGYAGYDKFFAEPLSNAHLASIATYNDFVPAFRALLKKDAGLPRFYADVRALAALDRDERHARLAALAAAEMQAPPAAPALLP